MLPPPPPCPNFVPISVFLASFPSPPLCHPPPCRCPQPPTHPPQALSHLLCFTFLPLSLPLSDSVSPSSPPFLCVCASVWVPLSVCPTIPSRCHCLAALFSPPSPPRPAQAPRGLSTPFFLTLSALFPLQRARLCWVSWFGPRIAASLRPCRAQATGQHGAGPSPASPLSDRA